MTLSSEYKEYKDLTNPLKFFAKKMISKMLYIKWRKSVSRCDLGDTLYRAAASDTFLPATRFLRARSGIKRLQPCLATPML